MSMLSMLFVVYLFYSFVYDGRDGWMNEFVYHLFIYEFIYKSFSLVIYLCMKV